MLILSSKFRKIQLNESNQTLYLSKIYDASMRKSIIYTCILAFWATFGTAQNALNSIQQKITDWQSTTGLANASIGITVSDSRTNEKLIESKPQLSLVPASILKTITTATALEVFGPDFRFQTTLSHSGKVRSDTLFGDLQIMGGGDPTLGSKYFPDRNPFLEEWGKSFASQSRQSNNRKPHFGCNNV